jgi:hypothetical protein
MNTNSKHTKQINIQSQGKHTTGASPVNNPGAPGSQGHLHFAPPIVNLGQECCCMQGSVSSSLHVKLQHLVQVFGEAKQGNLCKSFSIMLVTGYFPNNSWSVK